MSRPSARSAGVLLAWLAAVAAATLAGMVAVGAIGNGIVSAGDRPLSEAEVSRLLAESSSTPPAPNTPAPTTAPTAAPPTNPSSAGTPAGQPPAPAGQTRVFTTAGGTVIARCVPGIQVVSATPAQGYRVKDVEPEDGGLRVRFETGSGGGDRVEVQLTCAGGIPNATTRVN